MIYFYFLCLRKSQLSISSSRKRFENLCRHLPNHCNSFLSHIEASVKGCTYMNDYVSYIELNGIDIISFDGKKITGVFNHILFDGMWKVFPVVIDSSY